MSLVWELYQSKKPDFIQGVKKAVDDFTIRRILYAPVIQACTYHEDVNLYGAFVNWLQEETQW